MTTKEQPQHAPPLRPTELWADEVAEMRHKRNLTLTEIAAELGLDQWTVDRAHRLWHDRHPEWASGLPLVVLCGRPGHISPEQRRDAVIAHRDGERSVNLSRRLGVARSVMENLLASLRRHTAD